MPTEPEGTRRELVAKPDGVGVAEEEGVGRTGVGMTKIVEVEAEEVSEPSPSPPSAVVW